MKILVIDDTTAHQKSARQTLKDHDLTVVGSHDEALEALSTYQNQHHLREVQSRLSGLGLPATYEAARNAINPSVNKEAWQNWCNTLQQIEKECYWDVVLSDLLMPAGRNAQGGPGLQYVGQEMPVGWSLAIQAAISGAKYVAVATDMNHHHHPASASW